MWLVHGPLSLLFVSAQPLSSYLSSIFVSNCFCIIKTILNFNWVVPSHILGSSDPWSYRNKKYWFISLTYTLQGNCIEIKNVIALLVFFVQVFTYVRSLLSPQCNEVSKNVVMVTKCAEYSQVFPSGLFVEKIKPSHCKTTVISVVVSTWILFVWCQITTAGFIL